MEFKLDTAEFNESINRYVEATKSDMAKVLNTKAWYIARKACWYTQRADKKQIKEFVEGLVRADKVRLLNHETNRMKTHKYNNYTMRRGNVPAAALLINKHRGMRGEKGLYGEDMTGAMDNLLRFRMGSIGFIASGWIGAIRKLDPQAEIKIAAAQLAGVKIYGVPKGGATIATEDNLTATIFNHAKARSDKTGDVWMRVARNGLQFAIDDEVASMDGYIKNKMQERASKLKP